MHGIRVLMAKWYVDNLSEETKKGLNEKASQGIYPALAPLGYRNNTQAKTIEVDPKSAPIVRQMYDQYATGQHTLRSLRKWTVEERMFHPRSQRPMSVSEVESVLKNPFYYGMFYWGKRLYPGIHEPLITKELFDQVQIALKRFNKPKFSKHLFTFRGLLTCGHCGCQITAERQKGRYIYYRCSASKGKCPQTYLREERLIQLFLEQAINPIALTPSQVEWLRKGLRKSFEDQTAYHKARITALRGRYEQLQRRLDQIYLDRLDGKVNEEFWEVNTQAWRKEQEELRQVIDQHERANIHFFEDGMKLFELAKDIPAKYVMAELEEKREILSFVASNYTITDATIVPAYNKPFCWLTEFVKTKKWGRWLDDVRTCFLAA